MLSVCNGFVFLQEFSAYEEDTPLIGLGTDPFFVLL